MMGIGVQAAEIGDLLLFWELANAVMAIMPADHEKPNFALLSRYDPTTTAILFPNFDAHATSMTENENSLYFGEAP